MNDMHTIGQAKEVAWYRKNGQFPGQRIARTPSGIEFVVGDWSWNRGGFPREFVDMAMQQDVWKPLHNAKLIRPAAAD